MPERIYTPNSPEGRVVWNAGDQLAESRRMGDKNSEIALMQLRLLAEQMRGQNDLGSQRLALERELGQGRLNLEGRGVDVNERLGMGQLGLGREGLGVEERLGRANIDLGMAGLGTQERMAQAENQAALKRLAAETKGAMDLRQTPTVAEKFNIDQFNSPESLMTRQAQARLAQQQAEQGGLGLEQGRLGLEASRMSFEKEKKKANQISALQDKMSKGSLTPRESFTLAQLTGQTTFEDRQAERYMGILDKIKDPRLQATLVGKIMEIQGMPGDVREKLSRVDKIVETGYLAGRAQEIVEGDTSVEKNLNDLNAGLEDADPDKIDRQLNALANKLQEYGEGGKFLLEKTIESVKQRVDEARESRMGAINSATGGAARYIMQAGATPFFGAGASLIIPDSMKLSTYQVPDINQMWLSTLER